MASNVLIAAAALFALLSAQCTAGKPEAAILQEGDNGSAVVLLAIARLQQSGIFPDDNMMTTNCCEGLRTLKLVMEQPKHVPPGIRRWDMFMGLQLHALVSQLWLL